VRAVASATISLSEMTASRVALRSPHCDRLSALDARVEGFRVQQMIGGGGVGGCQQGSQPPNIQQVALDLENQLLELGQVIHVSQTTSAGKSPAVQNCTLPRLRLGACPSDCVTVMAEKRSGGRAPDARTSAVREADGLEQRFDVCRCGMRERNAAKAEIGWMA